MSDYAWLIPLLPAVSAAIIIFFGKRMPKKGAEVGIAAIVLALGLSVAVAADVFSHNFDTAAHTPIVHHEEEGGHAEDEAAHTSAEAEHGAPAGGETGHAAEAGDDGAFVNERALHWTDFGGDLGMEAGQRVDGLAAMMFLLVTFVSTMVHVYSTGYMHGDPRYTWYFALLSMFTASMLLLVIANNLMQVLVGWELVGVCSFLLIGFWWEEKKNSDAAIKAFLTTKLGDVGLIVGVIALWGMFRTFNIGAIIDMVGQGVQAGGAPIETGLLTFALCSLFVGAIGKSAQFPLHTWLPDAMAGPTPVSALIHAATMVTAGVFLVARLYPVYSAAPAAKTFVAVVGGITLLIAGLLAVVQDDVKKVLAYSTISQLGYMVAALGFSYTAGIFHLFTHGFFKALLFLGAGSLIHAAHSNDMSQMGGMRKFMPVTFWTFLIGSLALMALPPLAGFWSKDEILASAQGAGTGTGTLVFTLGIVGGMITAFYMTRLLWLVFAGEYRGHGHPHESPRAMAVPLVLLAVPSVLIGLWNLPIASFQPSSFSAATMFSSAYWAEHPAHFVPWIAAAATGLALVGILAGTALYRRAPSMADDPMLRMGPLTKLLVNKYYLDALYHNGVVRPIRDKVSAGLYWINDNVIDRMVYLAGAGANRLGRWTYEYADQKAIDGAVNGVGVSANWSGGLLKFAQSGNVQLYAGAMFVGVIVLGVLFATAA